MGRTTIPLRLSAYCVGTIVSIALLILILLAWLYVVRLATSVNMVGMDLTGTRMVSAGTSMVMISKLQPWSAAEFVSMFLMWAAMMVADAAVSHPDGSLLCTCRPCDCLRCRTVRPDRVVCNRLSSRMAGICICGH